MKIEERFFVAAPIDQVWRFITDPTEVGPCVPGCSDVDVTSPTTYRSRVTVGLGPIKAAFNFEVEVTEMAEPSQVLSVTRGEEGSRASLLLARNVLRLDAVDGGTEVFYSSEISISGRLGKFGLGVMKKKAKSLGDEFAQAFRARVEGVPEIVALDATAHCSGGIEP